MPIIISTTFRNLLQKIARGGVGAYVPITRFLASAATSKVNYLHVKVVDNKAQVTGIPVNVKLPVDITFRKTLTHPSRTVVKFPKLLRELSTCSENEALRVWELISTALAECVGEISILRGMDIKWAYDGTNAGPYDASGNILSCMSYSTMQDNLDLYAYNPTNIGLATVIDNKKVYARALLLTGFNTYDDLVNNVNVKTTIARIYACSSKYARMLADWGKRNSDFRLSGGQTYSHEDGGGLGLDWFIPIPNWRIGKFPYMDHFSTLRYREGLDKAIWTNACRKVDMNLYSNTLSMNRESVLTNLTEPILDPEHRPNQIFVASNYTGNWKPARGMMWDKTKLKYVKQVIMVTCGICGDSVNETATVPYNGKPACRVKHDMVGFNRKYVMRSDLSQCKVKYCARLFEPMSGKHLCDACTAYYDICPEDLRVVPKDSLKTLPDGIQRCLSCAKKLAKYCKTHKIWETTSCTPIESGDEIPIGINRIRLHL